MSDDYFKYLSVNEGTMLYWITEASKHLHKERRRTLEVIRRPNGGWLVVSAPDPLPDDPGSPAAVGAAQGEKL